LHSDLEMRERVAVLEARADSNERLIERLTNVVLQFQAEATADRKVHERVLSVVERNSEYTQRIARASEETNAKLETYLPAINLKAGDAAAEARRAADATGRVQLAAPAEKSGSVKAIARVVFRAPATKILAVAVLVIALGVAAGAVVAVYQEMHALKARLGGAK
jgi:uncharacterized coiled-coil protein SlyX